MTTISPFARIHPNVHLGAGCRVGDFVIIGEPPRGSVSGELPTVIGDGAIIRSHTVIYAGNTIGGGFQCGHGVLLRETNTIGHGVSIGSHTVIEHHVTIDDGRLTVSGEFGLPATARQRRLVTTATAHISEKTRAAVEPWTNARPRELRASRTTRSPPSSPWPITANKTTYPSRRTQRRSSSQCSTSMRTMLATPISAPPRR